MQRPQPALAPLPVEQAEHRLARPAARLARAAHPCGARRRTATRRPMRRRPAEAVEAAPAGAAAPAGSGGPPPLLAGGGTGGSGGSGGSEPLPGSAGGAGAPGSGVTSTGTGAPSTSPPGVPPGSAGVTVNGSWSTAPGEPRAPAGVDANEPRQLAVAREPLRRRDRHRRAGANGPPGATPAESAGRHALVLLRPSPNVAPSRTPPRPVHRAQAQVERAADDRRLRKRHLSAPGGRPGRSRAGSASKARALPSGRGRRASAGTAIGAVVPPASRLTRRPGPPIAGWAGWHEQRPSGFVVARGYERPLTPSSARSGHVERVERSLAAGRC